LEPFRPMLDAGLGWHRPFTGDYDHATEAASRALQTQPANFWARMNLGWAYEQKAMYGEAEAQFRAASEQQPMAMGMSTGGGMQATAMSSPTSMQMSAQAARTAASLSDVVVWPGLSLSHA